MLEMVDAKRSNERGYCGLATKIVVVTLALLTQGVLSSAEPKKLPRHEATGSMTTSIHVPPVRSRPPKRTRAMARPPQYDPAITDRKQTLAYRLESLKLAIEDLIETYGDQYPLGRQFLARWGEVNRAAEQNVADAESRFIPLRDEALLANPLLKFDQLLVLKRKRGELGLPTNHQCNTCLRQDGYDNELAILSPVTPDGKLSTLFRPPNNRYVGEMDLDFDAGHLLFTMPNGRTWQIHEIGMDGEGLRQVSREIADVDNFDPCYLPNGQIVFASTAAFTGVPCWHGKERACCLYLMQSDGSQVRQLCFDQDLDLHPAVLDSGQVIYSRWDYTGLLHAYVRPLMVMNPDGTGQRAVYGSNSYYPNCLFFPRGVPGQPNKVVAVVAGYHGRNRMGELAVLDISAGWSGPEGIIDRITHRGEPIVPVASDFLTVNADPQFLHPYPLSEKYILTAMQRGKQSWGIYLVDVFDNVVPVLTHRQYDYFEPIPVVPRPAPPIIPERIDMSRDDAVVLLHDIYKGNGLPGVPRGTIKRLRIAAYHFGYPGMAGPDKVGRAGPWEVMRILGTVPVYDDGSAKFRVPANTPLTLQALDSEGKAVQLMRSWYTAMPGESAACVGCHETPRDTPTTRLDMAAWRPISEIEPWYGPPRGFDFAREVQPVLDQHCVECHDGRRTRDGQVIVDLRDASLVEDYAGLPLTKLGATRLEPQLRKEPGARFQACLGMPEPYGEVKTLYTPAYEALIPFIRRPNIEDGAALLRPGEYHADTSELIELLQKGHHGVQLDREAWDRLIMWIDLNGPCHGTWGEVASIPNQADRRREQLARATGGPPVDPESVAAGDPYDATPPTTQPAPAIPREERRELPAQLWDTDAGLRQADVVPSGKTWTVSLGKDVSLELLQVPAGRFVIGDTTGHGAADEWPPNAVSVKRTFWMSRTEITNAQMQAIIPEHHSGYFTKRQIDRDGPGIPLNAPNQPALRVSWNEAMEFCRRLSASLRHRVELPTEAQWEYAARAGTLTDLSFGSVTSDFAQHANMADRSLACLYEGTAGVALLQPIPAIMEVDDQAIATAEVASYRPNAWGLYDMHGNVAEWTRSIYLPYPYREETAGVAAMAADAEKRVVRGGSYYDRPSRCRSSHRRAYPPWQAVHDVGFRIVVEADRLN